MRAHGPIDGKEGVVYQQVITIYPQATDGRPRPRGGVRPVPVVHARLRREVGRALLRGLIGPSAVPLSLRPSG